MGNFYFEVEGEKAHFYWEDLQVKWYNTKNIVPFCDNLFVEVIDYVNYSEGVFLHQKR